MAGRQKIYNEEDALDKAINVFWEKGYENASSRDLQQAMGIGAGSFYLAYPDGKRELFEKSMKRFFAVFPSRFLDVIKSSDNPLEAIRQYFYAITDEKGPLGQYGCYFSNTIIQTADEQLKNAAVDNVQEVAQVMTGALLRAKNAGLINPQLPVELWEVYLLNLWTGLNTTKYIEKDAAKLRAAIDYSLTVFN
jgi:TetR/AcrR family transcriptional repressor of nem operon